MKTKIIINVYGKICAAMAAPVVIDVDDYASFEDAMNVAKHEASKIDRKLYKIIITSV